MEVEKQFDKFCLQTLEAVQLLYKNALFGQMVTIIYSSIETFGFIDSDLLNERATGSTFENWVDKYLLSSNVLDATKEDLWGARCGVLHTHSSISGLSKLNKAREIQYLSGNRNNPIIATALKVVSDIDNGKHTIILLEELVVEFCQGLKNFETDFKQKLSSDNRWSDRLSKVLTNQVLVSESITQHCT